MKKYQEKTDDIPPFKGVPSHLLADDREIIILKKAQENPSRKIEEYTLEELKEIYKNQL